MPVSQQRKLSTASSPPSYKVWTGEEEEEVDRYGYVLPGSPGTPERGKLLAVKQYLCLVVLLHLNEKI